MSQSKKSKKENMIELGLYDEMRDAALQTIEEHGLERRPISKYFDGYSLDIPVYLRPVFGCPKLGIYLNTFESDKIVCASLTQMEKPKGSGYNFDLAFTVRPAADLRAPLLHGDAQDPMGGMKGMFGMDLLNYNKEDVDIDEFLGENLDQVKEALDLVDRYQKSPEKGRGKYTVYLKPYKSKYRVELEQPDPSNALALKRYYQDILDCFRLYYGAYFASVARLDPDPGIIESNKAGFDEYITIAAKKDFAAKMGKRMYKQDFSNYFSKGFWSIGEYGRKLKPKKKNEGLVPGSGKKGLIVYSSIYGSTIEASYWLRSLLGDENYIEVKRVDQVITVKPFDYVLIGSHTRQEKPSKAVYSFVEKHKDDLATKEVAMFLCCGDVDETQILQVPGGPKAHLIGGRNYFADILKKYPELNPVALAGFGGRQVLPNLNPKDQVMIAMVGKLAKEGAPWQGLDIWESMIPERVEHFANEVRKKILGLKKATNTAEARKYWNSVQPATLADRTRPKQALKPYDELINSNRVYYSRSRIKGNLETAVELFNQWADKSGTKLYKQSQTFFNVYYHAVKSYGGKKDLTIHTTAAELPEDPGNVHIGFRCFEKSSSRGPAEQNIQAAEKLLWGDGRRVKA